MPFNTKPYTIIAHLDDQSGSRDFLVEYTNTTGRTLYVMITVYCESTAGTGKALAMFFVDDNVVKRWVVGNYAAAIGHEAYYEIHAVIKPGQVYKLLRDITGGTVDIDKWWEGY